MILLFFRGLRFAHRYLVRLYPGLLCNSAASTIPDALSLRWRLHSSSGHIQIGERTQHKQGVSILGQATVADLGETKHALDHHKDMLDLGDKTQLATMLFAADKEVSKLTVFLGASLALVVASGIGVLAGGVIAQFTSERHLHYIAGFGFIGIGTWTLFKAYAAQRPANSDTHFRCYTAYTCADESRH